GLVDPIRPAPSVGRLNIVAIRVPHVPGDSSPLLRARLMVPDPSTRSSRHGPADQRRRPIPRPAGGRCGTADHADRTLARRIEVVSSDDTEEEGEESPNAVMPLPPHR